jgi:hypothetical protein
MAPLSRFRGCSLAPGIAMRRPAADLPGMAAAGRSRIANDRIAPRLLEDCATLDRLTSTQGCTARDRLEALIGNELAGLLCRALTRSPQQSALPAF